MNYKTVIKYNGTVIKEYTNTGGGTLLTDSKLLNGNIEVEYYKASRLPEGYTQLEYISTTGTQWINTQINVSNIKKVSTKLMINSFQSADMHYLSGRQNDGSGYKQYISWNSSKYWFTGLSTSASSSSNTTLSSVTASTGTTYEVESTILSGSQILKVNDSTLISTSKTCSDTISFNGYLFSWNAAGGTNDGDRFIGRSYWLKFFNTSDNLILHFIPAKRNSDAVIGMYDIVSDTFFTNSGTGTFGAGPEVG